LTSDEEQPTPTSSGLKTLIYAYKFTSYIQLIAVRRPNRIPRTWHV